MAPKRSPKVGAEWQPVEFRSLPCVAGGLLAKPALVQTGLLCEEQLVKAGTGEDWLNLMVCREH